MIRTRNICPKCGKETQVISDNGNLKEYKEIITHKPCKGHPESAEDKLLKAIFGRKK